MYQKHCILLKITFQIPLFHIEEVCEQLPASNYWKYGLHISSNFNKSYMLWSLLLLVFLFHFLIYYFQNIY